MTLRALAILGLLSVSVILFAGCQTSGGGGGGANDATQPEDNPDTGGEEGTGGQTDDADGEGTGGDGTTGETDDGQGSGTEDGSEDPGAEGTEDDPAADEEEPELTEEQEDAIEEVVEVTESLGAVFAVLADADAPGLGEGPIAGGDCPVITFDEGQITLDYGDGCSPILYPDSTFSGSVTGTLDVDEGMVDLTFEDFTVDGESVSGHVAFSYQSADGVSTLEGEVDLTFDDDETVTGDMTVEIDQTTGEITIVTAELVFTYGEFTDEVTLTNVHIDYAENGNFLPDAGTAAITLDEPPPPVTLTVTFTSQTPVDGTVTVGINGHEVTVNLEELLEDVEEGLDELEDIDAAL